MAKKNQKEVDQADKTGAAKAQMMALVNQEQQSTEITTKHDGLLDGYSEEEIAALAGGVTGTEDIPLEQRRPPLISWNLDMTTENGVEVVPERFFNMQTEEQFDEIFMALLGMKHSREASEFDKSLGKKIVYCRSFDMEYGTVVTEHPDLGEPEEIRRCEGCPLRKAPKGERKMCTTVQRFVAYDLEANEVFVFNAMRSSFIPLRRHLEKNFLGQLKIGLKRADIPLFMLGNRMTLKVEKNGSNRYYVPMLECLGPINNKKMVLELKEMAEMVSNMKTETVAADESKDATYTGKEEEGDYENEDDIPF